MVDVVHIHRYNIIEPEGRPQEEVASEVHAAMVAHDLVVAPLPSHDRDGRRRARPVEALGDEVGYAFSRAWRTATGSSPVPRTRGRDSRSRRQEPARA